MGAAFRLLDNMSTATSLGETGGSRVPDERMPYQIIDDLAARWGDVADEEVLVKLAAIPPLADEEDGSWESDDYWQTVAYPYLALWQLAATRRLRAAIPLMLDRACFGDPGEIMRNLCHALEAIVERNWPELTDCCIAALESPRSGTRLWAAYELRRLRDPAALPALAKMLRDPIERVREWAESAYDRTKQAVEGGHA
jgi:HEAT repeat protein